MAYTIEEEQEINEIKTWWNENYKSIIAIVVLAFAGVFGWKYWQNHQAGQIQSLSAQYDQLIYGVEKGDAKNAQLEQFAKDNSKTAYAVLALFERAKSAVENNDFSAAESALKQAMSESSDEVLTSVAALRLAAVQFQLQSFDAALETLKSVKDSSWDSRKNLLTGDILAAKGDKAGAKASFEAALANADQLEQQLIQVRLNNL
ncbi:MAG: YfgM family protein [[Pasteurella] aerogenes]|nr:YfgM family protein [[Pasteurella] aerogenes]MCU9998826.1 YfgM family protein [[Pasteurella] aerogenes]MDY4478999.1 YfgM family protein [[Pasteurella] aerogenes]